MFKKVLEEAISKIESKEKDEENRKIAEETKIKYLKNTQKFSRKDLKEETQSDATQSESRRERILILSLLNAELPFLSSLTTENQLIERSTTF